MREFTEKEKQWLIKNYESVKQKDCAKHLGVSDNVVRRLAKELGIYVSRKTYDKKDKPVEVKKKVKVEDVQVELKGYCVDCIYYRAVGHCLKTGSFTGALNKKLCFKDTEE